MVIAACTVKATQQVMRLHTPSSTRLPKNLAKMFIIWKIPSIPICVYVRYSVRRELGALRGTRCIYSTALRATCITSEKWHLNRKVHFLAMYSSGPKTYELTILTPPSSPESNLPSPLPPASTCAFSTDNPPMVGEK